MSATSGSDAEFQATQRAFWNRWNETRETTQGRVSLDQQRAVIRWLEALGRTDLEMIDIGCGAGWLCDRLLPFGRVTGTDLSDEVLARTAERCPTVKFVAGDFLELDFGRELFDVAVTLETLSHVPDHAAFVAKTAELLKPGGYLMMATQNRATLEKNDIAPPEPGQRRNWVNREELLALLEPHYVVEQCFSITPKFNRGPLKIVNAERLHRAFEKIGLKFVTDAATRMQENAGMGWTLMALGRKR